MNLHRRLALPALLLVAANCAHATITLPRIFSDNLILQEGMAAPIWGIAEPGEKVTVELQGQSRSTTADNAGNWNLRLDPLKSGGPYELKVTGSNAITINNVLVGEVWHASGQSNMHLPLSKTDGAAEEIARANHPEIRYFQVDPWHPNNGQWVICAPATAGNFSAVAYYFAADLQSRFKKPIGILDSSVNGAVVQTFISPRTLAEDKSLARIVSNIKTDQEVSGNFRDCISRLIPYAIRGVIWYQGEGNRDYPVSYQTMFPAMIRDWRKQWNEGDFPFLFVQLANYGERRAEPLEGKDAAMREAQLKSLSVANTAMVVTIDLAPPTMADVHYTNKKPVGSRLALAAAAIAYGEKIEYSGPQFQDASFKDGKAIVTFTHLGGGLVARGDTLKGFTLSAGGNHWVRAQATIEGDHVIVQSADVPKPVAVRYAFEKNPECNLYNKADLPASPFRTDTLVTFSTRDGE